MTNSELPERASAILELMRDEDNPHSLYPTYDRVWLEDRDGVAIGVHRRAFDSLVDRNLIEVAEEGQGANRPTLLACPTTQEDQTPQSPEEPDLMTIQTTVRCPLCGDPTTTTHLQQAGMCSKCLRDCAQDMDPEIAFEMRREFSRENQQADREETLSRICVHRSSNATLPAQADLSQIDACD